MFTSLKNAKRAIGLGIAIVDASVDGRKAAMAFSRKERQALRCKALVA